MEGISMKNKGYWLSGFLGITSLLLVVSFILYPDQVFHSALRGLGIWWDVVFPALLPFFIISEILMGFGLAHFFGVLLEPLMRPLFRVPGTGAFVLTMGLASGYPIGAKLTVSLRQQNLITRSEGERLVSFTSTSDPLFMFGAVAVGFFHDVSLGIILVLVHYSTTILVGIFMRFHEPKGEETDYNPGSRFIILRAFEAMHHARMKDGRTIGKLLGDAVSSSLNTLLLVGGLIIIFSVFMKLLSLIHVTAIIGLIFGKLLFFFGIPTELSNALIYGLFEVTLGAQGAAQESGGSPLIDKLAIASAILAWSGLSVHAQVASILSQTDIRYKPYLFARILHTLFAATATYLVWEPMQKWITPTSLPTFVHLVPGVETWHYWEGVLLVGIRILVVMTILILLSLFYLTCRRIVYFIRKSST
jgi:sporulation integral membrane protein YlbJ